MEEIKEELFAELNDLFSNSEHRIVKQELFAQIFQEIEQIINKPKYYSIYKIYKFSISDIIISDDALDRQLKQFNMERVYNYIGYIGNNKYLQVVISKEKPIKHIMISGEIKLY